MYSYQFTNTTVNKIFKTSNTRLLPRSTTAKSRFCKARCETSSSLAESAEVLNGEPRQSLEGVVRCSANYVPLSPISFLERAADVYRERTSIVYGNIKYTWEETHCRCVKLASALNHLGISRGDVVSLFALVFSNGQLVKHILISLTCH